MSETKREASQDVEGCQRCGHYALSHEELGGPCSWGMGVEGALWCRCDWYVAAAIEEDE